MTDNKGSSSTLNLDLTDVEDADELASAIETFYRNDSIVKTQLAWNWERNQLMLDGRQWIVYEGNQATGGLWKPLKISKENEYIPRPVTNYIFDAYQTLKGYILKSKPRISVRPNTINYQDKTAAKLASLVSETNYERLKEDQNYEYAASGLVLYGTVFKKSYWDTSFISQIKVPRMVQQPSTDPNTGEQTGVIEVPAIDPQTGDPLYDMLPLGDVNTDVVDPYRMAVDPLANDLHKMRWLMEYSIQPIDWVKSVYGRAPSIDPITGETIGFTGRIDELKPETSLNGSMRRFFNLKTSSGVRGGMAAGDVGGSGGSDNYIENSVVLKEYYEAPSEKHRKGRLIAVAGTIPLYIGDSPCEGPELGDWHPYSECRWEVVPGRFWGKGPLDDASEIQKQLNSIDATIILTRKTMAIPQKLLPLGMGVEPGKWTGRPGQEIPYRADGSGAKPETIPAAGVHETVFQERQMRLEDFKQISGAIDILKGDRPPGVTAASALSMLYEVGTGKLFPVLDRWKKFIENDQKKQLRLISKNYKEPREDFIRSLKMKNSELSDEDINKFIGSDLNDNCNVIIEAGSNIPKLQAAEQALLLEVAQTGALALDQPGNRSEFLTRLGLTGFDADVGPDTKRAEWENDIIDNMNQNPNMHPVVLVTDKHEIHIETHGLRTKQPNFMSLPIQIQQAYFQHIQAHEQMQAQAAQAQQIQSMQSGQPSQPQPPAPPPSQPQGKLHPAGNGINSNMKSAIFSDALVPGLVKGGGK